MTLQLATFEDVLDEHPDLLEDLLGDTPPVWYDAATQEVLLATYRTRLVGDWLISGWIRAMKDRALVVLERYSLLWGAYQRDLLDTGTVKSRTSSVSESEDLPETASPFWIDAGGESDLEIADTISADRFLASRVASVVDYKSSTGGNALETLLTLQSKLRGFRESFAREFESLFVGRY